MFNNQQKTIVPQYKKNKTSFFYYTNETLNLLKLLKIRINFFKHIQTYKTTIAKNILLQRSILNLQ